MRRFGFSTGALAKSDVKRALEMTDGLNADAVEFSALRINELEPLVGALMRGEPPHFGYVAFHAPSRISSEQEPHVVALLLQLVSRQGMNIVVHPDTIHNYDLWRKLGEHLCVENMDHRKPFGRTAEELDAVFQKLPEARLCFDIGHAHEIDRSMSIGYEIVKRFRDRIAHIHASEVTDECEHRALTNATCLAFKKIADMIPLGAAVIVESVTSSVHVAHELEVVRAVFDCSKNHRLLAESDAL